jgi:ribosomal protein S18 acetylase RimI-like enzyme
MSAKAIKVQSVTWTDLPAVTRMTFDNMTGVDRYFTKMIRNPLGRWATYVTMPLYLRFSGRGYKILVNDQLAACGFLHMRRHSGYIYNINVNRPYRRQGIGRHLMRYLEQLIVQEGRGWAALQVDQGNLPAEQLYQQLGYKAYHPHFLRREADPPISEAVAHGVAIERLSNFVGQQLYKRYRRTERQKGDFWAAAVVDEYDAWSEERGDFWRCRFNGREVGCALVIKRDGQPLMKLTLAPDYWGHVATGGIIKELVETTPGKPAYIDLFLESSAHHQEALAVLIDLGFRQRSEARILMLKALADDQPISGSLGQA